MSREWLRSRSNAGAPASDEPAARPPTLLDEFGLLYRQNAGGVTDYFARRSSDPYVVARRTSETFDRAAAAFARFDRSRATGRAWLFRIAAEVGADLGAGSPGEERTAAPAEEWPLSANEVAELETTIGGQAEGRRVLRSGAGMPSLDLAAVELVDLAGLDPDEAAVALGVYRPVLRRRLARARAKLFKERDVG